MEKKGPLTQAQRDRALLLSLAWPCVVENLATTLVSLVDTAMVGSIGAVATAAVGLCATPTWLMNGIVRALGIGGTAIVAREIGAGERELAEHAGRQVLRVAAALSLLIALILYAGAPFVPVLLRAPMEVRRDATDYLRILSFCSLFHYTAMAAAAMLRGAGDTRTTMVAGLMSNALNVAGNFLLIYPTREMTLLGMRVTMPGAGWGVRGAAAASALSMGAAGIYILHHMAGSKSMLRISVCLRERLDAPLLRRVVRIAMPAALERVTINVGQMVFAAMFATLGTAPVAAYHITTNIEALGYMPANGFSAAATTLVGQRLGAGKPEEARRLGLRCIRICLALLCAVGAAMLLVSAPLAALFSVDAEVVRITTGLIVMCGLVQPMNALTIVAQGALGGAGDTVMPFVFSLVTMWSLRILFSLLLGFALGLGVYGIYGSMLLDLAVRSALLVARFSRGKWMTRRI